MKTILFPMALRLARRARQASMAAAAAIVFAAAAQPVPPSLTVVFDDCTEFAGLGSLPAAQIQGLVPAGYTPASFGPGVAGMVARAARCERISVGGAPPERGTVSQTGVNLVSPDGTGDINNYAVQVHSVADISHFLHGSVGDPPSGAEFPFLANWWFTSAAGRMRMSTQIPAFSAGPADVALYTSRASELGGVLGTNRFVFPLLPLRGKFSHAVMTVTLSR